MENYCHNDAPTPSNNKKQGCPLYNTKPENTPPDLIKAIESAEVWRKYKQRGCLIDLEKITAWEFACFDAAETASEVIESESIRKPQKETEDNAKGKTTNMGEFGKEKKGGAFSGW